MASAIEVNDLLGYLCDVYPGQMTNRMTEGVLAAYEELLADLPAALVWLAGHEYILAGNEWFPSAAKLRQLAARRVAVLPAEIAWLRRKAKRHGFDAWPAERISLAPGDGPGASRPDPHDAIWREALSQLQKKMTSSMFEYLLSGSRIASVGEGTVIVCAKDAGAAAWLEARLGAPVAQVLEAVMGRKVVVSFSSPAEAGEVAGKALV